jgi:hypothetical protein
MKIRLNWLNRQKLKITKMEKEIIMLQGQLWVIIFLLTDNEFFQTACIVGVLFSAIEMAIEIFKTNKTK